MCNKYFITCYLDGGLRTTESIGFRCGLEESSSTSNVPENPRQFIENRLSKLDIKHIANIEHAIPDVSQIGSFLMKHETKFIGIIGQVGNNEEFNNIVSTNDQHMTIVLTWKAIVSDNSSAQRHAVGQHFLQLGNLYET